jgi:hypothetical protein
VTGTASSFYLAEISALQAYQKQILQTLEELTTANASLVVIEAVGGVLGATGSNNGLGNFDEAVQLSNTYSGVMQTMMTNFKEISELVTAMANALGKSAQNYQETEQQITDSFNQIVTKYEAQSGGFSTPGAPAATAPAPAAGQPGTSNTYYTATSGTTPATSTTTTQTTTTPASTTTPSTGTGSISQDNNSNASNNTSGEE